MFRDRVKESATTTGTGNFTLAGAATGFETFNTAFGNGTAHSNYFEYVIQGTGGIASEWEVGRGHLSASTTLVRDQVYESSNSDALVNFSAGTKDVFCGVSGRAARHAVNAAQIFNSLTLR